MGIQLPGWLRYVGDLVGEPFPEGDETECRRQADRWRHFADELERCKREIEAARSTTLAGFNSGAVHEALETELAKLTSGQGSIDLLASQLRSLGEATDGVGLEIETAKMMFIANLAVLAATVAALMASIWINWSAPAQVAIAVAAARAVIAKLIQSAVMRLVQAGVNRVVAEIVVHAVNAAAINALISAGINATVQGTQIAQGNRNDFDFRSLGTDVASGAIQGAIAGPLMRGAQGLHTESALRNHATNFGASFVANAGGAAAAQGALTGHVDIGDALRGGLIYGAVDGARPLGAPGSRTGTDGPRIDDVTGARAPDSLPDPANVPGESGPAPAQGSLGSDHESGSAPAAPDRAESEPVAGTTTEPAAAAPSAQQPVAAAAQAQVGAGTVDAAPAAPAHGDSNPSTTVPGGGPDPNRQVTDGPLGTQPTATTPSQPSPAGPHLPTEGPAPAPAPAPDHGVTGDLSQSPVMQGDPVANGSATPTQSVGYTDTSPLAPDHSGGTPTNTGTSAAAPPPAGPGPAPHTATPGPSPSHTNTADPATTNRPSAAASATPAAPHNARAPEASAARVTESTARPTHAGEPVARHDSSPTRSSEPAKSDIPARAQDGGPAEGRPPGEDVRGRSPEGSTTRDDSRSTTVDEGSARPLADPQAARDLGDSRGADPTRIEPASPRPDTGSIESAGNPAARPEGDAPQRVSEHGAPSREAAGEVPAIVASPLSPTPAAAGTHTRPEHLTPRTRMVDNAPGEGRHRVPELPKHSENGEPPSGPDGGDHAPPDGFDNPAQHRSYGPGELAPVENPAYQSLVESQLRQSDGSYQVGADPRTNPYGRITNDGGPTEAGRSTNCVDCSLSALASFHGEPTVSAPRFPDMLSDGSIDRVSGEVSGLDRAQAWLGDGLYQYAGMPIPEQFAALHDQIAALGPGSSALVITEWHARDADGVPIYHADGTPVIHASHATVVVYPHDATGPVWWDPQHGLTSDHPPAEMVSNTAALSFTAIPHDQFGADHSQQGAHDGGTQHPGTGARVPDPDQVGLPVSDPAVREVLGVLPDPAARGGTQQQGGGAEPVGGRRGDRSSDAISELVDQHGGRGLPEGQARRPEADGGSDLSVPVADHDATHPGGPGEHRLPDQGDVADRSHPAGPGTSPADLQAHVPVRADRHEFGEGDVLRGVDQPSEQRDMAGGSDDRVLGAEGDPAQRQSDSGDPGPWHNPEGASLNAADHAAANDFLNSARAAEPHISETMRDIVGRLGDAELTGLDHRLKTDESFKRKFAEAIAEAPNKSTAEILANMKDAIRYTVESGDAMYSADVRAVVSDLLARGYEPVKFKNSWDSPGYQGINSFWRDPVSGHVFEVQFHTPSSFEAKMVTHGLYEEQRLSTTPPERVAELERQQAEIFAAVPRPDGSPDIGLPYRSGPDLPTGDVQQAGHGLDNGPPGAHPIDPAAWVDGRCKISGHGDYDPADGTVTVPEGTSVTVYAEHGSSITDGLGNVIETGGDTSGVFSRTFGPGEEMPNYTVHPPDGLDIHGTPHVVDQATRLSDLIHQAMGDVDLATCTYDATSPTNKVYDVDGVLDESTGTITKYSQNDPANPVKPPPDDSGQSTGRRSEPLPDDDGGPPPRDDDPTHRGDDAEPPWHDRDFAAEDPQALRQLWDGLSPEDRRALYLIDPMFGERAALPVDVCDTYARQAVQDLRGDLMDDIAMRANINDGDRAVTAAELDRIRFYDNLLNSVQHSPDDTPRFLLGFEHDFRSITAVGNPDTASHTVVFVPGTFTSHDTLNPHLERPGFKNWFGLTERFEKPGYMEVCGRIHEVLEIRLGQRDLAVIDYQGYHAPQSLMPEAAMARYAELGGPGLRDHVDRLQHTNGVVDKKIWVAGHSYGTAVVGESAQHGHGLSADGIINLGSPGMRVADVSGLMLHGQHLVAGEAPVHTMTRTDDPINVVDAARRVHLLQFGVGHGLMPHHPEFGGHVWDVDAGSPRDRHNAYFDRDNVALEYIARVVSGELPPQLGRTDTVPGRSIPAIWSLSALAPLLTGDQAADDDEEER